jgi:hypothetical protein
MLATFNFLPNPYQRPRRGHGGVTDKMDVNVSHLLWRAVIELAATDTRGAVTDDLKFKLSLMLWAVVAQRISEELYVKCIQRCLNIWVKIGVEVCGHCGALQLIGANQ